MSQSLRTNVQKTTISGTLVDETNLERGRIWTFTPGHMTANTTWPGAFCWISPGSGTVNLEVWGASGSSGSACCCGYGLPGNPGAYSSRSFTVVSGCFVCGNLGLACRNISTFRGCSDPTQICWLGSGTNGCICAQGGASGRAFCINGGSMVTCFVANGACNTVVGTGCGFVCNHCSSGWIAQAFGGTVNCFGPVSSVYFGNCNPCCICCNTHYVKTSAGVLSCQGNTLVFGIDFNGMGLGAPGVTYQAMASALTSSSRVPTTLPFAACWAGLSPCACYQSYACTPHFGFGIPGGPTIGFSNNQDYGMTGSNGAVRIQFIAS